MPYDIRKLPNQELYRVYNKQTKAVHSYATTLENAKKQVKLLHMVDAGVELKGTGITAIDKSSTGVLRVNLNSAAKKFLNDKLIPLITNTTINITESRANTSGYGRSQVFGYGNIRGKGFGEFKNNSTHPELYRALLIFGMKTVPHYIPFTAIQVNHNYKTKKHIDGNNIGLSLAVSFGDFTGGELVVKNQAYQTKEHPVIFNGALSEHFNKPIKGDRYSLVFFASAPKSYSDEQVYNLHNKVLNSIKLTKGEGLIGGSIETDDFKSDGIVSLPEFRSVKINLPTYMYKRLPDIKGKPPPYRYRLVVPITSSRNISSRKKATSLDISQKAVVKPVVDITENEEQVFLKDFSPADKLKIQQYYNKVEENERKNPDEIDKDDYQVVPRGKPLPCSKASSSSSSSSSNKTPNVRLMVADIETKGSFAEKSIPKPVSTSSKKQSKEDEELLDNDFEAFFNKSLAELKPNKKKSGKGLENIILSNSKMANSWIEYVKSFCAKNGMSYRDALRSPECKAGYKKGGKLMNPFGGGGVVDELGNQPILAKKFNVRQLGANAGKSFVSL